MQGKICTCGRLMAGCPLNPSPYYQCIRSVCIVLIGLERRVPLQRIAYANRDVWLDSHILHADDERVILSECM